MIDIDWKPDRTRLRQFAAVFWVGFTLLAVLAGFGGPGGVAGWGMWTWLLAGAGAAVGILGLLWPPVVRPVYLGWMGLAFPVGWLLSHLLLAVVYYGLFTLAGLMMRLGGRDALRLKRPPESMSLWVQRPGARPPESYFRRF
jgi:hypothetical protein